MHPFNRTRVRLHRTRAAQNFADFSFLKREAAERLCERLEDITHSFPLALDLGCHTGELSRALNGRGGVNTLICTDLAEALARQAPAPALVCDEEFLPFAANSFDAVFSSMALHWVNDLPGCFIQLKKALKPDGLLLANLPGARTLTELRQASVAASSRHGTGLAPLVAPFVEVRDAGALLQRAGFALPVVDSETITVTYDNAFALLRDLRGMGEASALIEAPKNFSRRDTFTHIAECYQEMFAGSDGRVPATFELVTLTAWKPDASQPKPLSRGSGQVNLGDVFN